MASKHGVCIGNVDAGVSLAGKHFNNVAYKCCADHCVLITSPFTTAPADGSLNSLLRYEQSLVDCCVGRSSG